MLTQLIGFSLLPGSVLLQFFQAGHRLLAGAVRPWRWRGVAWILLHSSRVLLQLPNLSFHLAPSSGFCLRMIAQLVGFRLQSFEVQFDVPRVIRNAQCPPFGSSATRTASCS